uniref:hypothetical protein n=1 Tax=Aliarcobacter cryaerophilus TaxID=28198 RepID=UPI001C63C098
FSFLFSDFTNFNIVIFYVLFSVARSDIIFTISELGKEQKNSFLSKAFDNFASLKRLSEDNIVQETIKFSNFSKVVQ